MLLESVYVCNQTANGFCDGIAYSPPKDALDSTTFNSYFIDGSFPLPEQKKMEVELEPQLHHGSLENELTVRHTLTESEVFADLNDSEKHSVAGSLNTCAPTETSSRSPKSNQCESPLSSKRPRIQKRMNLMDSDLSNSNDSVSMASSVDNQKEARLNSLINLEMANHRVTQLAIKIIDKKGPIIEEEWSQLSSLDQLILKIYVENIYGLHLTPKTSQELIVQLNKLIATEIKGKRNEEKLKKTVKKVNSMITHAFVNLNNLGHLEEQQLSSILFSAYFGHINNQNSEEAILNIFESNLAFSQKSFSKIVENQRYAEDFDTILKTTYVPSFVEDRQQKVLDSIYLIRQKIDGIADDRSLYLADIIKRSPWQLSEIIDGAKLCHSIIERSKPF